MEANGTAQPERDEQVIKQLSETELMILRSSIGGRVSRLYTPRIRVSGFWSIAPSYSFSLRGEGYLVIESDWRDTPKYAVDYHVMHVHRLDHPLGVPRVFDDEGRKMMGSPCSMVDIIPPNSTVVSVTVFEYEDSSGSERVLYDSGVLFKMSQDHRIAITVNHSIEGGVACVTEPSAIDVAVAEYRVRLELEP